MTAAGALVGGRFELVRVLGSGGMGRVVLAQDTWRDRKLVALKLAPEDDAGARRALEHEFLLLSALRHPCIVTAHEFGSCVRTRQAWFAMEHAAGRPLADAARTMPRAQVASLLAQLARGLDFLHSRGWVHGDVKAENVVLAEGPPPPGDDEGDGAGEQERGAAAPVLLDFGLARRKGDPPGSRSFSGTLTHAAPELLAGAPADPRSDLYALGVLAHELLAGRLPFEDRDPLALAEAHRAREAPPLLLLQPSLPRGAADLVDRLLAKDPDARPRDGAAVAEALDRAFPGCGVESLESALSWAAAPRLVGRDDAEQACATLLSRARDPREDGPRVLWLLGGSGQGKTALLGQLASRTQAARGLVLRGRPEGEPLSLLARPLRDVVRSLGPGGGPVAARAAALSAILPELAPERPAEPLPPDERLLAIADAAWEVLRAVATRPVVLLLDGLEGCEPEDARVLELLARLVELDWKRGRRVPFAIAATISAGAGADRAWAAPLAVGRQSELAPLTEAQMRELLELMLPGLQSADRLAAAVWREGGGSARLLEDWCAELVRRRVIRREGRGHAFDVQHPKAFAPPPGAAEQVAREIGALPPDARELLAAACEAPAPLNPAVLARAARLRPAQGESALDVLERRRLVAVVARPEGRRVAPSSEQVRAAGLAPGEIAAEIAGRLLDDAGTGSLAPAELAVLAERAGRLDAARGLLGSALEDAERRRDSFRAAAIASRLAALSEGRARRDTLRRRAVALLESERFGDADEAAALSRAEAEGGAGWEPGESVDQLLVEGRSARRRGDLARAAELLAEGSEAARTAGHAAPFELDAERARTLLALRHPDAEALVERLQRRDDIAPTERLAARVLDSARLLRAREDAGALAVLEAARRSARGLGMELTEASCENNMGIVALRGGELAAARRHFDRAVRLRRKNGVRGAMAGTLSNLALVEIRRGRWREAARHARAAAEVQEDVGNRGGELLAVLNEAAAQLNAEDVARAVPILQRALALARDEREPTLRIVLLLLRAEESQQLGDLAAVGALASQARELAEEAGDRALLVDARTTVARLADGPAEAERVAAAIADSGESQQVHLHVHVALAQKLADVPWSWLEPWARGRESRAAHEAALRAIAPALDDVSATGGSPAERAAVLLVVAAARRLAGAPPAEIARLVRKAADAAIAPAVPSVALQLHAAHAWLSWTAGDAAEAEKRLEAAVALLRRLASALPPADRERFLARPDRGAFRSALLELRRSRLETAHQEGWEALQPRRAPSRPRPASREDGEARREAVRSGRRAQKLAEILEISRGISTLLPVDELLGRALDSAMRFMDADRGFIVLGRPGEELRFAVARDRDGRDVPRAGFAVSRSVLEEVMRTRQPVLSSDARADERFTSKVSVLALDLRSVLVAPLVASSEVIGAVYLDNLQASGVFGDEDRELLGLLASQAAVAVENARLHETRLEKERIEQELSVARGIQQSLLPRELPEGGSFRLAAVMQPARELGGDWYDVVPGAGGSFTLTVGDVSGKGVGAALFMVMARTILRAELQQDQSLDRWLLAANAEISAQLDDDKFLTLVALRAGGEGGTVRYSLAGHEPPIVYRDAAGTAEAVPEGGLALGMLPSLAGRIEERRLDLEPGDVVACVSDGVTECRSPGGELYGRLRLRDVVAAHGGAGADALLAALLRELEAWRGAEERSDDVTIVVLEARPRQAAGRAPGEER